MDIEVARSLKIAIEGLHETPHGRALIEFLEDKAGYHAPTYAPDSETSIVRAAGRTEMIMILRNLKRLTPEQIVEQLCQEGQ